MLKKHSSYPTKTSLNLMVIESASSQLKRYTPMAAVALVLIVLFCKFGVIDRLSAINRAELAASTAETLLADVDKQLTDYDNVLEEYTRYFSDNLGTQKSEMPLDCMQALKLVKTRIMSKLDVASISFDKNTVTIQITGTALNQASTLMAELSALPEVAKVNVYTANTSKSQTVENGATILLTITFQEVSE